MSFDLCWVIIIIIFILGLWRYTKHSPKQIKIRQQGLFLMLVSVVLAIVYYYFSSNTTKANMYNGEPIDYMARLRDCEQELTIY